MTRALGARSLHNNASFRAKAIHSFTHAATPLRSRAQVQVRCQAVRFPAALPLLPFTPKEVLPPGSCKVLRLYDSSSYMLLLEELLSSPHQMLVHTAVEPTSAGLAASLGLAPGAAGQGPTGRLGAYEAGGFVFCLSTIMKVIDVKQTDRGVLLRVQSEGRVAVKSLAQTRPYFRAVVVPLTDTVDLDRLQAPMWRDICGYVERLRCLMRDVQNLASKFKCPETANLQRAMQWVDNPQPLVFSSSSMLLNSRTADIAGLAHNAASPSSSSSSSSYVSGGRSVGGGGSPLASYDDFQPSKIIARQIQPDNDPSYTESQTVSSGSDSESDVQYAAAAAAGAVPPPPPSLSLPGAAAGSGGLAAAALVGGGGLGSGVIRSRPSLLDLERACRLSLAAIQLLPRSTEEERDAILRHQAAALETQDVLERLELAHRVMSEARALLSAKCALMALSTAA